MISEMAGYFVLGIELGLALGVIISAHFSVNYWENVLDSLYTKEKDI